MFDEVIGMVKFYAQYMKNCLDGNLYYFFFFHVQSIPKVMTHIKKAYPDQKWIYLKFLDG